jgi:ABC-2 type transport system permease protein
MNVLRIAWRDAIWVAKDWQAFFWMLAMPLILAFLLGSILRFSISHSTWIPVVDLDNSELSRMFIEQMEGEQYTIAVMKPQDERFLKQGWRWGVVIPCAFGDRIVKGQRVTITVVKGQASPERIMDVQSRLTRAIVRFTKGLAVTDVCRLAWSDQLKSSLRDSLSRPPLLTVEKMTHGALRPPPVGFYLSLPGFLVTFVLMTIGIAGGVTLVDDRTHGRFLRLLAAPVSAFEVYLGKILGRVFLGLLQSLLLLISGSLLFQIPLGNSPGFLLPVIVCLAAFAGSLSMLCGVLCQTEKQVLNVSIFFAIVVAALGGCWWPIEIVPEYLKNVATLTPSYWAMHGLQRVMYFNKSHEVLLLECPILLAYAAAVLLVAMPFLGRHHSSAA